MEQYLTLIQDNIRPSIVKPKIGDDNSNFMKELRRKLFKGTNDEDAHKHVQRVLEIADLFHFPGVTHDAVMLRVFPITLKGPPLRWKNRLSASAKKLEEILNFKQEMDETLYYAWERYSDLLYICPQHDLNSQQKVHIFYIGLDIPTLIMLNSKGFIPLMTPTQALKSIQVMADHSHNLYDVATSKERINDFSDNVDTKKLKAIQVSCKICERAHLTKECPLKKKNKAVEQSKYIGSLEEAIIKYCEESIKKQTVNDEWIGKFIKNMDLNLRALETTIKNMQVKTNQLTQMVLTNPGEKVKAKTKMGEKDMKEPVPRNLPVVQPYKIHKKRAQEDEGDMDDGWDIMIKDVERLRQILTPTIHTLLNLEPIVQLYMPRGPVRDETVHITPPDDDYVAPPTNPIWDKHLNKFGKEYFDMTRVDENGSHSKEMEFEVTSTRPHVVKRVLFGHNHFGYAVTNAYTAGYEFAQEYACREMFSCHYQSKYRATLKGVSCSNFTLSFEIHFLKCTIGTLDKQVAGWE
ncbi:hypothetical protein Tco_0967850 [Tanacetum coccineum]